MCIRDRPAATPHTAPTAIRPDSPVATGLEIVATLIAGFLANLALRAFAIESVLSIGVFAILMALIARRSNLRRSTLGLLVATGALLPWFVLRTEPALLFVNVVTVLVLLAVAAGYSLRGTPADTSLRRILGHVGSMLVEWIFGGALVFRYLKRASERPTMGPIFRGMVIAVPVLAVFTVLLASADAVFAGFLLFADFGSLVSHLVLSAVLAVLAFGYVSRAAHETSPPTSTFDFRSLGPIEVAMVLGSLTLLFAGFTATQLVVALGGADQVLQTEGLTQAEHAREGFFELMFASALAGGVVAFVRALRLRGEAVDGSEDNGGDSVAAGRDWFVPLAVATLLLTIVLAGFSLQRFILYVGSFGLTLDRVWAMTTVGVIIILLGLYIADIVGFRADTSWYPMIAVLGLAGLVFALNFMNPGARVAEYNMTISGPADVDIDTLVNLSDDAIPEIVSNLGELGGADRRELVDRLCSRSDRTTQYGLIEYNRAAVASDSVLDDLCGDRRQVREQTFFD